MPKQVKTRFEVGDRVKHVLMGWDGIVSTDLTGNPYGPEHYGVKFNVDGDLQYRVVFDVEITKTEAG